MATAAAGATAPPTSAAGIDAALRILGRLLQGFAGAVDLRLWDECLHRVGQGAPAFTLVLRDPALLRRLVTSHGPLPWVDAYLRGALDVEGDLYSALALKDHFERLALPWGDKLALLIDAWRLPTGPVPAATGPLRAEGLRRGVRARSASRGHHTRASDRRAITFHYDVSNAFYALWLDAERVYSCAYFETADDTLDQAQRQKLEHICRKLRLEPGERLLDIGCGWGALLCWAARHHGVRAHGITLSRAQHEFAQARIVAEGLQERVSVELRDYRDLAGDAVYDKVASIGMFEHVGLAQMPTYLRTVHRVLRPGGLFLNHGITHDEEGWSRSVASAFINRHVFPDGELDCVSNIQLGMERAGFEIQDVEALRRHYALTLRHWVRRLEARREQALAEVDESTWRTWRLYMAACALEFEAGGTGVYQLLATRRGAETTLPLTRRDLYSPPAPHATPAAPIESTPAAGRPGP